MARSHHSAARRAHVVLSRIAGGRLAPLPVTVRFWDGSALAGATGEAGVLEVRREAAAYLLHEPNQLGLARAYIAGALELDGDLEPLLDVRHRLRDVPPVT